MNKDLFKPIKDQVKFFERDPYNAMPVKELINRLEKMLSDIDAFDPDDVIEIPYSTNSSDGVIIMFPGVGSIAPSDIKDYIRKPDEESLSHNEIVVSDYASILRKAVKELKKARSRSVRFSFVNLAGYGDIKSFIV